MQLKQNSKYPKTNNWHNNNEIQVSVWLLRKNAGKRKNQNFLLNPFSISTTSIFPLFSSVFSATKQRNTWDELYNCGKHRNGNVPWKRIIGERERERGEDLVLKSEVSISQSLRYNTLLSLILLGSTSVSLCLWLQLSLQIDSSTKNG